MTVTIINKWLETGEGEIQTSIIHFPSQFLPAIATGVPFKPDPYPTKSMSLVLIPEEASIPIKEMECMNENITIKPPGMACNLLTTNSPLCELFKSCTTGSY